MALRASLPPKFQDIEAVERPQPAPEKVRKTPIPLSRLDKIQVAFFLNKAAKSQLDRLALKEGKRLQAMMLEALDMLFQSRQLARIADDNQRRTGT